MSFTELLYDDPQLTREEVMATLIRVADELDMPDKRGASVIAGMVVSQEVGVPDGDEPFERRFWCPANHADEESFAYPHDSISDDNRSVGYFQQQKGPNGELWWGTTADEMDLHSAATTFMSRLKKAGYDASSPVAAASSGCAIQNPADWNDYIASCSGWWDDINALYDSVAGTPSTPPADPPPAGTIPAPQFTELDYMTGGGRQPRNGARITNWLIHTEEGNSTAEGLARYCNGANLVSYHYTCRDGIVCDVVDTDYASWSVLDANNQTINFCFAGSRAAMSREEWLQRERDIEICAYLAVQDCKKYGISTEIIAPPYGRARDGISDHRYVTQVLGIGTHTDVGDNFPWDRLAYYVDKYLGRLTPPDTTPPPPADDPSTPAPVDLRTLPLETKVNEVLCQSRGRWGRLGKNKSGPAAGLDRTPIEALGAILDHLEGTDNADNTHFSW